VRVEIPIALSTEIAVFLSEFFYPDVGEGRLVHISQTTERHIPGERAYRARIIVASCYCPAGNDVSAEAEESPLLRSVTRKRLGKIIKD
jgi:hypothetical protein